MRSIKKRIGLSDQRSRLCVRKDWCEYSELERYASICDRPGSLPCVQGREPFSPRQ